MNEQTEFHAGLCSYYFRLYHQQVVVALTGLELRDRDHASASRVLGLKEFATIAWQAVVVLRQFHYVALAVLELRLQTGWP